MVPFTYNISWAQGAALGEIAKLEYRLVPSLGDTEMSTYTFNLGGGIKMKSGFLGIGLGYTNHNFSFFDLPGNFESQEYEEIHVLRARLFYRHKMGKGWSANFSVAPGLSSNFAEGISGDDFQINVSTGLSKRWEGGKGPATFSFGLAFGTAFGKPQFFPTLSFGKKLSERWNYVLGIPVSGLTYRPDERHSLRARATFFGTYANISSTVSFNDIGDLRHTKLQVNGLDFGVEHNFRIQPNFTTVIRVGYWSTNQFRILDGENTELFNFETTGAAYISMGLTFNLNKRRYGNKK